MILLPEVIRQTRQRGGTWVWWMIEGIIVMHSAVRPTQRYLLPMIFLGIIGIAATATEAESHAPVGDDRWSHATRIFAAVALAASGAWALAGLSFVVAQGRAAERIWREADRRGVVESTRFGPVEVHLGYRASLGDGTCFEIIQIGAGDDTEGAVAVAPMRIFGRTVREYVLRTVDPRPPRCPDVSVIRDG